MKNLLLFLAVSVMVTAALISLTAHEQPAAVSSSYDTLNIGDTAPSFLLKNVDGNLVSLESIRSATPNFKGAIITFTCNTCPFAVMYEDRLIALHNEFAPRGWPVVAIQPNDPGVQPGDSFEEMQVRASEKEFPFPYLFDEGQKVYPQYGASRTPHVFLTDEQLTVRYIGTIDNNPQDASAATEHFVKNAIAAIEIGKDPDPNTTKAIGCSIKVKK